MSDNIPLINNPRQENVSAKNAKSSKSFSNYFEMLKLHKHTSNISNGRQLSEKDNSIQTIKEKLLKEAYLLQLEQEQLNKDNQ